MDLPQLDTLTEKVRFQRAWWYVVAAGIVVVAWLGAVVHTAGAWDVVRESAVQPVGREFDAKGSAVGVLTDLRQPGREIICEAVGPAEDQRTEIPASPVDVSVDSDGTRWHLIALLDEGRDGMNIECAPTDENVDSAVYGHQVIDEIANRAATGRIIVWTGILLGTGLAVLTTWNRRRQ